MPVKIPHAVIVITGASSGIGKAAALEFASRGGSLVLSARRIEALEAAAEACARRGARALAVPADVTDEEEVRELARRALDRYGRIDVWVNNASVYAAGSFAETPPESFRRVMETNFFGYVHGARAAMPVFRRQGHGVLINVGSMVSRVPVPYFSAYVASKHAVAGLGESLRQELTLEGARDIHVCTVMPAAMDTPLFAHAANYTGRALKAMPPVYPVEKAARAIAACAERPKRQAFVGNAARLFALQYRLSAALTENALARMVDRTHFYPGRTAAADDGNLFAPLVRGATAEGGWSAPGGFREEDPERGKLPYRAGKIAALGTLALAAGALILRARHG